MMVQTFERARRPQ